MYLLGIQYCNMIAFGDIGQFYSFHLLTVGVFLYMKLKILHFLNCVLSVCTVLCKNVSTKFMNLCDCAVYKNKQVQVDVLQCHAKPYNYNHCNEPNDTDSIKQKP